MHGTYIMIFTIKFIKFSGLYHRFSIFEDINNRHDYPSCQEK